MTNDARLLTAVALPFLFVGLEAWVDYRLGWRPGETTALALLFGPICLGAFLIATGDWSLAGKIGLIVPYVLMMLSLVIFIAMFVGCAWGGPMRPIVT